METQTLQRAETAAIAGTMWRIDPVHSTIDFSVKHMMFATVHGRFDGFRGTIRFDRDRPNDAEVEVEIDAATIDTGTGARDAHLRSADFLDTEHFPIATFHSTSVEGGESFVINGELTIRDITHPIPLKAEYQGRGVHPSGVEVAGFEATGKLNRKDFGLNWNQALESGGVLVSDEVKIDITLQANRITS